MTFINKSLDAWLFYLENQHQQEIQLGLTRVQCVADRLDVCDLGACVVITVAGTNGKGSTVAALEAIYSAAGFRVGSYTSPHLLTFNERIRINRQPISDQALCNAFAVCEQARDDIYLTYFEMTTLAALYYFKQSSLDVVILEVGMGGRLDATNIIDADLAIITTIDLDHQAFLGETREAIGYEKAGILRPNQLFIYADNNPPASVINYAMALTPHMQCLNQQYSFSTTFDSLHILREQSEPMALPRPGIHLNAAVAAVIASDCLSFKLPVSHAQLCEAMSSVGLLGRKQVIKNGAITTILDVAHNPQAVSSLAEYLTTYPMRGNVHAVFSALQDKDLCGLIRAMGSCVNYWYPATLTGKRAASEQMLLTAFHAENKFVATCFSSPESAYIAAMQQAQPGDLIVVYGSFLTVSAVLAMKTEQENFA